jgi:drug/metabolite transporter (DMT)-like permease
VTQSLGLIGIGGLLVWQGKIPAASHRVLVTMLAIGLLQAAACFLFYRAFEIGKLSLVAPITSGFAVVTAILALLTGERPNPLALGGALLLIIGVLLVTSQHRDSGESNETGSLGGVPEAIAAAFAYGIVFWALDFVVPTLGPVWPLAALRAIALLCLFAVFLILRPSLPDRVDKNGLVWSAIGVAAADTGAWISFAAGTQSADVAIVTALASLYSAVAILYGLIFLRERLLHIQWLGVGLILMGVLLVGVK